MQVTEMNELAKKVADLKLQKDQLAEQSKEIGALYEAAEIALAEALIGEGHERWDNEVGMFSLSIGKYWSVDNKEVFLDWVKANHPELLSVNATTLTAWMNAEKDTNPALDHRAIGLKDPFEKKKIKLRRK